jgi:hypothetical protein
VPVRAVRSSPPGPEGLSGLVWTPLLGFKDRPSADTNAVRPLPGRPKPSLWPGGANLQARSALVVPPDSDGLLRSALCRSIAPCNRPWGSPCFRGSAPSLARRRWGGGRSIPDGADPSKLFPPWQLYRVTTVYALSLFLAVSPGFGRALPRACGPGRRVGQPQGFEPPSSPLLASRRCRRVVARCFLGFLSSLGCVASGPGASGSEEPSACRCRFGGPRGGRRAGGGGAAAVAVAPEGVAGRAVARGLPIWWRWGSEELRGASRGAAGAPKSSGGAPVCAVVPRGALVGLRRAPVVLRWAPMPPKPRAGPARRAPEGGWSVGPVVRRAAPPRGVGLSGLGGPSDPPVRRWVGGGSWGSARLACRLSEERRRGWLPGRVRSPEGVWARLGPQWTGGRWGASPSRSVGPPGIVPPRRGERCASRGDLDSPGTTSWLPRRSGAVRFRGARRCRSAVGLCGPASAPPAPKRWWGVGGGPSVGGPRPRGGLVRPVQRVPWSVQPEGFLDSCVAEALQGRHGVPFAPPGPRALQSPCFAEARQGRHVRSTEVGRIPSPPKRFRGASLVARGRDAAESSAPKRGALGLPWRAEARGREASLSRAEARGGEGGESSRVLCGEPPSGGEGAFLVLERARATAPFGGKLKSHTLKGCGYVKEQPEGCCR